MLCSSMCSIVNDKNHFRFLISLSKLTLFMSELETEISPTYLHFRQLIIFKEITINEKNIIILNEKNFIPPRNGMAIKICLTYYRNSPYDLPSCETYLQHSTK